MSDDAFNNQAKNDKFNNQYKEWLHTVHSIHKIQSHNYNVHKLLIKCALCMEFRKFHHSDLILDNKYGLSLETKCFRVMLFQLATNLKGTNLICIVGK